MQLQMSFVIATLVAAMTMMVQAQAPTQLPVCSISPAPRLCRIANNQVCPGGCVRPRNCPGVVVITGTSISTVTRARTTITSISTVTNTTTATVTPTVSASVITVTASASASSTTSTPPPACKTEVPYANFYTFPDTKCTNTSGLQPESSIPFTINGLSGAPYKFSNLTFNATSLYNESSCVTLPDTEGSVRSIYFTVDGIPENPFPSCTMNLYRGTQCIGDSNNDPTRYLGGGANKCQTVSSNNGTWRSVQFKCAYARDLCSDNEIFLGTCIKY